MSDYTINSLPKAISVTADNQLHIPATLLFQLEWDLKVNQILDSLEESDRETIKKPNYPYQEEEIATFVREVKPLLQQKKNAKSIFDVLNPVQKTENTLLKSYKAKNLLLGRERNLIASIQRDQHPIFLMKELPAGTFIMGALENDPEAEKYEQPRREVTLTRSFGIGKYPVTLEVWNHIMRNQDYEQVEKSNRPVFELSWINCIYFCNLLSEEEGLEPAFVISGDQVHCNFDASGYRLPTEAEWEYAARGEQYHKYAGSNNLNEVAWHFGNSQNKAQIVGQKQPNGFGLYDISGNVNEWCWDWYEEGYHNAPLKDPKGPTTGQKRVFRGGCWRGDSSYNRLSFRDFGLPSIKHLSVGIRLCRTLSESNQAESS